MRFIKNRSIENKVGVLRLQCSTNCVTLMFLVSKRKHFIYVHERLRRLIYKGNAVDVFPILGSID